MTDEVFIERASQLIGDIGLEIWRLRFPSFTPLFVQNDPEGHQTSIRNRWIIIGKQFFSLIIENG